MKRSTPEATQVDTKPGLALAQSFLRGEIAPFDEPIENSDAFATLCDTYSETSANIESAVMELAHGSCHALTLALAEALGLDTVLIIRDRAGMPVHSAIHDEDEALILDANGVHRVEDALSFWSQLAGSPCRANAEDPEMLEAFYDCDEDERALAMEDFDLIAAFAQEESISQTCSHEMAGADLTLG